MGSSAALCRRHTLRRVLAQFGVVLAALIAATVARQPVRAGVAQPRPPDLMTLRPTQMRIQRVPEKGKKKTYELRFTNTVGNLGPGDLILEGVHDEASGETIAYQVLQQSDGSTTRTEVGRFVFDGHHDHWHFADFASYELRTVAKGGGFGKMVAGSTKVTFCLQDTRRIPNFEGGPLLPVYSCSQNLQGISVGWTDVYSYVLPGQEISLKGVPNGRYWLVTRADPSQRLAEGRQDNNLAAALIRIHKKKKSVQVLRHFP